MRAPPKASVAAGRRRRARGAARHADIVIIELGYDPSIEQLERYAEDLRSSRGPRFVLLGSLAKPTVIRGRRR